MSQMIHTPFGDMTQEYYDEYMEVMTNADKIWYDRKQTEVYHVMSSSDLRRDKYNDRHKLM